MKKHIPNSITCCNLISGGIAVWSAFMGDPAQALAWIVIGAAFDFFDGMSARLLHVSSEIGKELDSLADDITFGLAPAAIVFSELSIATYPAWLYPYAAFVPFVAFLIAAFSALRLAKFNLDTRQATSFIGLPTPANALFWGALAASGTLQTAGAYTVPFVVALIALTSWLLVAEIPMFALKFKQWGWRGNEVRWLFIAFSAAMLLWQGLTGFAYIIAAYVVVSVALDCRPRRAVQA